MLINVINCSSKVSNADVEIMCKAIQIQLTDHVSPAWQILSPTLTFLADEKDIASDACIIYVIDTSDEAADALGFHLEETDDRIDGYVMCEPILSNGGVAMLFDQANAGQYSVSATLSHEILELTLDIFANEYIDDNNGTSWAKEICDSCEEIGYGIMVDGQNIAVSDFVLPNYFDPHSKSKWNYLYSLSGPFSLLSGGYAIQRTGGPGTEKQVFAENCTMPQWRKDQKAGKLARMNRSKSAS